MGPKFNDPLYFQGDDALEVCGPANFGPNDISLELLKVTVVDQNGVERHTPDLSILVAAGEMWETDIDAGLNYLEMLPTEGPEALKDDLEHAPRFGAAAG